MLTIKTSETRQRHRFGIFFVNCQHILQLFLVFLFLHLLTGIFYFMTICKFVFHYLYLILFVELKPNIDMC